MFVQVGEWRRKENRKELVVRSWNETKKNWVSLCECVLLLEGGGVR